MNIDDLAIKSANTQRGGLVPSSTGLTPDALPEVQKNSFGRELKHRGTTKNALSGTGNDHSSASKTEDSHWYALRTTYGREKKAYDYIKVKVELLSIVRLVDGKRKTVEESRLPNIFFAYGTEEEIKSFVYDNVNLPYLRFYYRYFHISKKVEKEPLIVSNNQIESLRIICKADADDIIVSIDEVLKSATKLFSVLLASKRPLITELADKLRLKYPLLPTISPCPTMRLEAIRSIIPISCRRYPKSV